MKPDPRDIAQDLHSYFPNFTTDSASLGFEKSSRATSILVFPILAAFLASALAWGDMSMMMSLVSLILHEHNVALTLISLSITLHIFGMYGLSFPLGRTCDRLGRRFVIILGGVILSVGALLTPMTPDYWVISLAIFLVGLGWSAANVGTSTLLSDVTQPMQRGRILGANDMTTGLASLTLPALGGLIISEMGFLAFGVAGFIVALPTALIMVPLRERRPGVYGL